LPTRDIFPRKNIFGAKSTGTMPSPKKKARTDKSGKAAESNDDEDADEPKTLYDMLQVPCQTRDDFGSFGKLNLERFACYTRCVKPWKG